MSVLDKLACALGRRDENPNKALAHQIVKDYDQKAVKELIDNLYNKDKAIQSDIIKVIDEIAVEKPELLSDYTSDLLQILKNKNNRMIWGAMAALDHLCLQKPDEFFEALPDIMSALDKASVITRDHGVKILVKLSTFKDYYSITWPLYIDQLQNAPPNQFPSYAEWGAQVVKDEKQELIQIIREHLENIDQPSRINRLSKVLKSLQKKS